MAFWSKFKAGEQVDAIIVHPSLRSAEIKKMKREANALVEDLGDRQYAISDGARIDIKIGKKTYPCYIADALKGVTTHIERSNDLLALKTYPEMASAVWDSRLMQWGFRLQPSNRMVAVAFILGAALGGFFALFI
jgi:hypothetical protein